MLTKYILESREFSANAIVLRELKFIKTFTVNEFKDFFGIEKIEVKKHSKGFLFFSFRDVIGLVALKGLPKNPRISIVVGKFGIPHYLLHEVDDIQDFYSIEINNDGCRDINNKLCHCATPDSNEQKIDYGTKILVDRLHYDIKNDDRFLLPFTQNEKIGFINKEAEIIIPASYQFVLDDFYHEKSLVRVGKTYGVAFERKTSTPAVYLRKKIRLAQN